MNYVHKEKGCELKKVVPVSISKVNRYSFKVEENVELSSWTTVGPEGQASTEGTAALSLPGFPLRRFNSLDVGVLPT